MRATDDARAVLNAEFEIEADGDQLALVIRIQAARSTEAHTPAIIGATSLSICYSADFASAARCWRAESWTPPWSSMCPSRQHDRRGADRAGDRDRRGGVAHEPGRAQGTIGKNAHDNIKKRSLCTEDERNDLANVAMLACTFGCDILFESGYIAVDDTGRVHPSLQDGLRGRLRDHLDQPHGRPCEAHHARSRPYFACISSMSTTRIATSTSALEYSSALARGQRCHLVGANEGIEEGGFYRGLCPV